MALEGFQATELTFEGVTRTVYRAGEGAAVVIMHEIPGLTPEVAAFARRVADAGFSVWAPSLLGTPGRSNRGSYVAGSLLRACISREFALLSRGEASPVTTWLRALCRHAHGECGGPGVGALGMCLTGGFALALMVDDAVMAPVLSQPSLPFAVTCSHRAALGISDDDLAQVRRRAQAGCGVLGLRFTGDPLCPAERFETLRRELGDGFEGIEIDSSWGNAHGIRRLAHCVLTLDLVDEEGHPTRAALRRVLEFFVERLTEPSV